MRTVEPQKWLIYKLQDDAVIRAARKHFHGRLLDIGCGNKPYYELLRPIVAEHIGVDHVHSIHGVANVELLGTAYQIPVPDHAFDCALCTSVLEHIEEPERALTEALRVLKVDGVAIYTVPFIWHIHEAPRDFFRFSRFGIEYLFRKVGFDILELKPLCGFWGTFGQALAYNIYRFNRGPLRWLKVVDVTVLAIQRVAYVLDKIDPADQWPSMYIVVAKKR